MNDVDQLCDRVAFIVDGKIIEMDTPRNLKLKYGKKTVTVEYHNNQILEKRSFDLNQLKTNQSFFDLLKNKDIETIHSGETTLEDIFIKVTGVNLKNE